MNIDATAIRAPLARFPTRVPGLDTVLRGGLFRGGVYMVQGCPGAGKTILVNQICFGAVAEGAHCVYMTLLAESHSRLIQQLQSLQFFDRTAIPSHITYLSAFRQLQQDGLQGILGIAQSEVSRTGATVLVIDGLSVAAEAAQSLQEMKRLVHDLQALASMQDCTIFLLASTDETLIRAEDTMVDGIIRLESNLVGPQPDRHVSILKSRGDGPLTGSHSFVIDRSGIRVFPRMESVLSEPPMRSGSAKSVSTGVATLDALFQDGGLPAGSSTIAIGPPGSGKTSLALQFLSGSSTESPGLAIGFYESPDLLLEKADSIGLNLREVELTGAVALSWRAPSNHLIDELGYYILEEIDRRCVQRLVIDGMSGLFRAIGYRQRGDLFFACLLNEVRRRGVTTLLTLEDSPFDGAATNEAPGCFSLFACVDNIIKLQVLQDGSTHRGALSIAKVRNSGYDRTTRDLVISGSGIAVGEPVSPSTS